MKISQISFLIWFSICMLINFICPWSLSISSLCFSFFSSSVIAWFEVFVGVTVLDNFAKRAAILDAAKLTLRKKLRINFRIMGLISMDFLFYRFSWQYLQKWFLELWFFLCFCFNGGVLCLIRYVCDVCRWRSCHDHAAMAFVL